MNQQNMQIYEWDVIDAKFKAKLSQTQYSLYRKVRSSTSRQNILKSTQKKTNSNRKFFKANESVYDFADQKNRCIITRSVQQKQNEIRVKDINHNKIGESLGIKKCSLQKSLCWTPITLKKDDKSQKRINSGKRMRLRQRQRESNENIGRSSIKNQRDKSYLSLSSSLQVKKIKLKEKNSLHRSLSLSVMSKGYKINYKNIEAEQRRKQQSTPEIQCHHREKIKIFLQSALSRKKCLKL